MPDTDIERLSQIATRWTLLVRAHRDEGDDRHAIFAELLPRYCRAIESYLRKLVGNDAAEDLSQEFALRFLRGEFRKADPNRGRFRDYVKSAVIYQAMAHRKKRASQVHFGPIPDDQRLSIDPDADNGFQDLWRTEVLNRAWADLEQYSQKNEDLKFQVLNARAAHPDATSEQLAEQLSSEMGQVISAANVRQVVHRARTKFAELLRAEVAATLPGATESQIEDELAELGLLKYFR